MGDRALIYLSDGQDFSPVTYLHWGGANMDIRLRALYLLMKSRGADLTYASARFLGICHCSIEGNTSLGCFNGPRTVEEAEAIESHGDFGVCEVNLETWMAMTRGGYGFGNRLKQLDLSKPLEDADRESIAVTLSTGARRNL